MGQIVRHSVVHLVLIGHINVIHLVIRIDLKLDPGCLCLQPTTGHIETRNAILMTYLEYLLTILSYIS